MTPKKRPGPLLLYRLALNCHVIRGGILSLGDAVEFLAEPVV